MGGEEKKPVGVGDHATDEHFGKPVKSGQEALEGLRKSYEEAGAETEAVDEDGVFVPSTEQPLK